MKRQSLFFEQPGIVAIHEEVIPDPGPHELLVETILSAVSAGTELLLYRGQMPLGMAVDETIGSLAGMVAYPLKYGYAAVGRVVGVGPGIERTKPGQLVFAFNPHESHFVVKESDALALPENLAPEAAVFLPNMETAVSFLMDGRPIIGEQVAVLGQGIVGLLTTALLARMSLASLVTLDAHPLRREWSRKLGATASLDAHAAIAEALLALQGGRSYRGADLVYEISGRPEALATAIALAGYNGRIVVGSWYGDKPATLDLGGRFHRSQMQIISSQVSHVAPGLAGRWTKARRFDTAWERIRAVRPQQLITHVVPLAQAADAYRQLDQDLATTLQVVLKYS